VRQSPDYGQLVGQKLQHWSFGFTSLLHTEASGNVRVW
jgi:hypothetical protein